MHQPGNVEASSTSMPGVVTGVSNRSPASNVYSQTNYHIDGNLYSVLTPSSQGEKNAKPPKTRGRRKARWKLKFHHQALPPEYREHYEAATEAASHATSAATCTANATVSKNEEGSPKSNTPSPKSSKSSQEKRLSAAVTMPSAPTSTFARTSELPYMGEITLDSKPRRGRKPKKADICHLIYKNYGTVFPSPKNNTTTTASETPPNNPDNKPKSSCWTKDGDKNLFQNSLAWTKSSSSGSLLEKRLTGNLTAKLVGEAAAAENNSKKQNGSCDSKFTKAQNNLREYFLTNKKFHNNKNLQSCSGCCISKPSLNNNVTAGDNVTRDPSLAQACVQRLLAYAAGLDGQQQNEPLNLCMRDHVNVKIEPNSGSDSEPEEIKSVNTSSKSDDFVLWPNAGVFVNPQLLYKPPSPVPPLIPSRSLKKKRKRSAIFIPPAESPTEVSICKFKFTGGAKPSLEEKKMLSVDAGGNFRFYSGTDKGMRSFLPHLQHSPIITAPPSPSTTIKKMNLSPSEDSFQLQSSPSSASSIPHDHASVHLSPSSPQDRSSNKRKRRSRKSEVREKLEQTFKEKGFLIQTQQLESAEGATYCKFRQLRKFTRYLFRSWRDYLPDSIQDITQANHQQEDCIPSNIEENSLQLSTSSS